jgi:hypothetical protein
VIVNASLAGVAPVGFATSCGNFERRLFRWSGHLKINSRARPRQPKIFMRSCCDCECVPRRSGARLGCNELQDFLAFFFAWFQRDYHMPGWAASPKSQTEVLGL